MNEIFRKYTHKMNEKQKDYAHKMNERRTRQNQLAFLLFTH